MGQGTNIKRTKGTSLDTDFNVAAIIISTYYSLGNQPEKSLYESYSNASLDNTFLLKQFPGICWENKLLAETMHAVSNDVIPSQLKDLFIPTVKIHSYNTRSSVSNNFYITKSKLEIEGKSFSRIGAKLWNKIPTKLRTLPNLIFKRKIRMILFKNLKTRTKT